MKTETLNNGLVRLTSDNGIRDNRNGAIYSEVVCKSKNVANFTEA